jgi:hypothetical protein
VKLQADVTNLSGILSRQENKELLSRVQGDLTEKRDIGDMQPPNSKEQK